MKKTNIIKIICSISLLSILIGCQDGFLTREPLDQISENAVFQSKGLAEAYLYEIYSYMPDGRLSDMWTFAQISDEARSKSNWASTIVEGFMSPSNNPIGIWSDAYRAIRLANEFLAKIEGANFDQSYKDRVGAEARFIRAFMYFDLARRYGSVPLITEPQSLDDDILVSQTPRAEVHAFVDSELNAIGEILPSAADLPQSEYGRATRAAAWALNGRNLLYAENYTKSAEFSKRVIDSQNFDLADDYNALFQSYGGSPEAIFEVMFNGSEKGHGYDFYNLPFSYRSDYGSQTNPTQEMVDAYEMDNGLPIFDPASGYDPDNPYENRDSRLYDTILYHGHPLKDGTLDIVFPDGADALLKTGNHTVTGYYIYKFIDESLPFGPANGDSKTSWKELRLGEVLLNYAEAQNEAAGSDQSVYDAINEVRNRADMPSLPPGLSKEEMRERIRHERRIELAFENHRWFDLIRWGKAEEVLHDKHFHGMKITRDESTGELNYDADFPLDFRPKQIFLPKFKLMPIPQSEIEKNPNLNQNPGY